MGCSNCFNGCADIISDQCVKYTGVDIPGLGIVTGDPLLVVENQIINKILTLMTGEGIVPIIDPTDLCSLVTNYLPDSGDITLNHVISALFQSICNLNGRVTITEEKLTTLNADYIIGCLSGVSVTSDTHLILQATINKLCEVNDDVTLLAADLATNYVLISEIDSYIGSYIAGIPSTNLMNSKMVPYTAIPFFAPPAYLMGKFDSTGAGIGEWINIYLCNGQNAGVPDLRGRTLVGATSMGTNPFNGAVQPGVNGNPTYDQGTLVGTNQVALTSPSQMPLHNHTTGVQINDPMHFHEGHVIKASSTWQGGGSDSGDDATSRTGFTAGAFTGLKGNINNPDDYNVIVTVNYAGGGQPHANIQPSLGTNYIIYIP
jgi:microcystin-dependent protein